MRDLSARAGMPMPRLYISPEQQPNAFATGRNPQHAAVAVTEGLLAACTWDEIRGVLAHELSHVRNRDILIGSVAAAVATGISFVANMAMWGAMFGGGRDDDDRGNPIALLATAILAPIAAGLLQMALSRSREFEADRTGAELIGDRRAAGPGPREARGVRPAGADGRPAGPGPAVHRQPARPAARSASPTCSAPTRPPPSGSPGCGPTAGRRRRPDHGSAAFTGRTICPHPVDVRTYVRLGWR